MIQVRSFLIHSYIPPQMRTLLYVLLLVLGLAALTTALCASAGSHCHDTGCRLHGGHCNSACQCMQRQNVFDLGHDSF
ncbi:hypothetical protein QR680_005682 [Steinernema hermaphroditum]|uniref:Uncharacterized protein n=1 Tax=Steinernema hermaphroditum TaxID=289476 RepID=A0AA39HT03_9BILA|nr:hypothetical protein QR680_005682 [Steinernema hermaphroditum]